MTNQKKNLTAPAWKSSNFEPHISGHTKCSHEEMQYFSRNNVCLSRYVIRNLDGLVKEPTSKDNILDIILTSNVEIINSVKVAPWISEHDMAC